VNDRDSWLFVPFCLNDFVKEHWGMNYFKVQLFERDNGGMVLRNVVNMGKEADFQHFVLLLPLLSEKKYVENEDLCWTIVGSEYERLGANGTLHGVYHLPVTLQQPAAIPVTHNDVVVPDAAAEPGSEDDGLLVEDEDDPNYGWV
jgi:hypothetical protein